MRPRHAAPLLTALASLAVLATTCHAGIRALAHLPTAPEPPDRARDPRGREGATAATGEVAKGVFGTVAILFVVTFGAWTIRRHIVRRRALLDEWRRRPPVSDSDFLAGCGLAPGTEDARRALLLRAACAKVTAVPPETIRPDDTLADPIWDSIGWLEVVMELEDAAGVSIPDEVFDAAGGSVSQARVRDLVRGVVEHARAGPPARRTKATRRLPRGAGGSGSGE
jgi:acyl carrier protein